MNSNDCQQNYVYVSSADGKALKQLETRLRCSRIDGLYFGAEFCEHLIPSKTELSTIAREAEDRNLPIYLVTGPAAIFMVPKYHGLLDYFVTLPGAAGVVFNDWGILALLRERFPSLPPVMGRLLFKNRRFIHRHLDPDGLETLEHKKTIQLTQLKIMRQTSFTVPEYRDFLIALGIERVDIDILPQGLDLTGCEGFSLGVHVPYGYLTSGRTCPLWEKGRRYPSGDVCVKKPCLAGSKIISAGRNGFSVPLIEHGNGVFYHVPAIPQGIQRVIHWLGEDLQ